jgi:CHAT domain-containing protein
LKYRKDSIGGEYYKIANSILKELKLTNSILYLTILFNLGSYYNFTNNPEEAEKYYAEAMEKRLYQINKVFPNQNEKERLRYLESNKLDFDEFYSFFAEYNKTYPQYASSIEDLSIIMKGLIFNNVKTNLQQTKSISRTYQKWQDTRNIYNFYVQNSEKAEKQGINIDSIYNLMNELEKQCQLSPDKIKSSFDTTRISWKTLQKKLSPDEAIVDVVRYQYFKTKYADTIHYAFVIITPETRYNPEFVLLENGNDLETYLAKAYMKYIQLQKTNANFDYRSDLKELSQNYLGPLLKKIKGYKKVYFSPDGIYNQINLNTLINPETGKYLIDEFDIRLVSNPKDLLKIKRTSLSSNQKNCVLFGYPQYSAIKTENNNPFLKPLPGTKEEVISISDLLKSKGWNTTVYTNYEASEENMYNMSSPKILHIATHGMFIDVKDTSGLRAIGFEPKQVMKNSQLRSILFFSGAENTLKKQNENDTPVSTFNDGLLTAFETVNLDLDNTDLVILSACETGVGEIRNGEGVYNMQRAFQTAGAKSVIMSLWSVPDDATKQLMQSFYQNMLNGKNKREAFRTAQLEVKSKFPEYYYWGGFVMVGE